MSDRYIGILGGSFNPVHVGHLRLAIEVGEATGLPLPLDRVDLVPCAQPPHKPMRGLLPFDLRVELLRAAVRDEPGLGVNDIEGQRPGPSYTWHTLEAYKRCHPSTRLLFIVGGEDFGALAQWYRGQELPRLADIAMVPRADFAQAAFRHEATRHWPEARIVQNAANLYAELPWGARLIYLPLPRLDISASSVRRRWLDRRSVRFLVPEAALTVLEARRPEITTCWTEAPLEDSPCDARPMETD